MTFQKRTISPQNLYPAEKDMYSHAIEVTEGKYLYSAGICGVDKEGNYASDKASQTKLALESIDTLLKEAGYSWENVLQFKVYIVGYEPSDFEELVGFYASYIADNEIYPAAQVIGVAALAEKAGLVEMEFIAAKP